jgi:pantetheine-phosphate adenylyltransferase
MQTLAIYPGTFDPFTTGHLDLIRRAIDIFVQVQVAVASSSPKQTLFTAAERVEMIREATHTLKGVSVEAFEGLLVDYLRSRQATVVLRGLRAISDFEYEFQLAQMNRKLFPRFEIVYMMPGESYTFISSSLVKEIAALGGDVSSMVPDAIRPRLLAKLGKQ